MNDNMLRLIKNTAQDVKNRKKAGRPSKTNNDKKKFRNFSVSVDEDQYKQIEQYAEKHFEGNISQLIRKLLRDKSIIS